MHTSVLPDNLMDMHSKTIIMCKSKSINIKRPLLLVAVVFILYSIILRKFKLQMKNPFLLLLQAAKYLEANRYYGENPMSLAFICDPAPQPAFCCIDEDMQSESSEVTTITTTTTNSLEPLSTIGVETESDSSDDCSAVVHGQQPSKRKCKNRKVARTTIVKKKPATTVAISNAVSSNTTSSALLNSNGKKRRENLPKTATAVLLKWLDEHKLHPYPTEQQKNELHEETQLGLVQISNWFINARRRHLPKMTDRATPGINTQPSVETGPVSPTTLKPSTSSTACTTDSMPAAPVSSSVASKQTDRRAKAAAARQGNLRKTASPRITRSCSKKKNNPLRTIPAPQ